MNNDHQASGQSPPREKKPVFYKGIQLEGLDKETRMAHSRFFGSNEGVEHLEALFQRDKTTLTSEQFGKISALSSVLNMNYQICNGGIDQYYSSQTDRERAPFNEQDVKHLDKDAQVEMLKELLGFGREVYPEQELMNERLDRIISEFDRSAYVEAEYDVEDYDYGYPEMIVDAPHDFDTRFYQVNDHLESLMEGYAQYLSKSFDLSLDNMVDEAKDRLKNREIPSESKEKKSPEPER